MLRQYANPRPRHGCTNWQTRRNPWYTGLVAALAVLLTSVLFWPRSPISYTATAHVPLRQADSQRHRSSHQHISEICQRLLRNVELRETLESGRARLAWAPGGEGILVEFTHQRKQQALATANQLAARLAQQLSDHQSDLERPEGSSIPDRQQLHSPDSRQEAWLSELEQAHQQELTARQTLDALVAQQLASLSGAIEQTQQRVRETQGKLAQLNSPSDQMVSLPNEQSPSSTAVAHELSLQEQLQQLRAHRERLLGAFTMQHPTIQQLDLEIAELVDQLPSASEESNHSSPLLGTKPAELPAALLPEVAQLQETSRELRQRYEQAAEQRVRLEERLRPAAVVQRAPERRLVVQHATITGRAGGTLRPQSLALLAASAIAVGIIIGGLAKRAEDLPFFASAEEVRQTLGLRTLAELPSPSPIGFPVPKAQHQILFQQIRRASEIITVFSACMLLLVSTLTPASGFWQWRSSQRQVRQHAERAEEAVRTETGQ